MKLGVSEPKKLMKQLTIWSSPYSIMNSITGDIIYRNWLKEEKVRLKNEGVLTRIRKRKKRISLWIIEELHDE